MISTVQLFDPDFQANPYPFYARMREEGLTRIDPGGYLALSRYADVVAAFRNTAVFSNAGFAREPEWLGPNPCAHSMHSMDPPEHTKMRNLVSHAFLAPVLDRTAPLVQTLVESAVGAFAERGEAEILTEIALPVTAGTIGQFMKLDPSLYAKFKEWSDAMMSIAPVPKSPEHARWVRRSIDEEASYLRSLIEERRRAPGEDMVSLLVQAEVDGQRLGDGELVAFLSLLLIAGLETTANLLAKSMLVLTERPDVLDRVRADPALLPAFIDEVLRWDPPAHSVFRFIKTDTEIHGEKVPAGARVMLMIGAANRDEHQFPDPDAFDIDRDPRGGLAFGHGIHFCVGMGLSKLEARLTLTELLRRFRRFERLDPEVAWNHTFAVRGLSHLRVRGIPA